MRDTHPSIIIAGAGPTGLAMGNLLGLAGIETLILERNPGLSDCPKAIALDDEALRICQAMGLLEPVLENVLQGLETRYISGKRLLARVAPTGRRYGFPFVSTFHQPQFEATLLAGLERFACVNIAFEHTVAAFEQSTGGVVVSVRTPTGMLLQIHCTYLLACDGGKSAIRRALGVPMQGLTFAQRWLVIDAIHDQDASAVATFFCNPGRPAVSVAAPHQGRRWEFMLLPGEREQDLLREASIRALIEQVGGPSHPQIIRKAVYTFHAVLANTFSRGRVFLLGDAAHQMPPFGGQGMNSGLRDAHNLAWKLDLVLRGLAASALLETYTQERREHVRQIINLSKFLASIVMPTAKPTALLRDAILLTLNAMPPVRDYFTEARMKPQPRYKTGFLLPQPARGAIYRALVGAMLPQPEIITSQGKKMLLDDVLGTGFALLRLHDNAEEAFTSLKADIWRRLGVQFVCVQSVPHHGGHKGPLTTSASSPAPIITTNGALPTIIHSTEISSFLRKRQDVFVLVRPDRYIYGVFGEEKAEVFASTLQTMAGTSRRPYYVDDTASRARP